MKTYEILKSKRITVEKAARMFGVPAQTLRDRISGNVDPRNCRKYGSTAYQKLEERRRKRTFLRKRRASLTMLCPRKYHQTLKPSPMPGEEL